MTPHWLKQTEVGIELSVYCQPGAKVSKIVGTHDGHLKISLQQPAMDNRANEALLVIKAAAHSAAADSPYLWSGQQSKAH
jgi:uncharacterized protein YggU (UPF0235/DUF167 family)